MSDHAPREVGLAFLDAIERGDLARLADLLHPCCTWWVQGWGELDRAALLQGLAGTVQRATSRHMTVIATTAEEDRVAIAAHGAFAFAEGDYCNTYHYLFTVQAGRIVAGREYLDTTVAARFYSAG